MHRKNQPKVLPSLQQLETEKDPEALQRILGDEEEEKEEEPSAPSAPVEAAAATAPAADHAEA